MRPGRRRLFAALFEKIFWLLMVLAFAWFMQSMQMRYSA